MKLSVYTGLVIGPLMLCTGLLMFQGLADGNTLLVENRELAIMVGVGFCAYGLFRLIRSIVALVKRGEE